MDDVTESRTREPAGFGEMILTAEFVVFRWKHERLRNNVEVFEAVGLLHSLDVFVQTIFARQFVRPGVDMHTREAERSPDLWHCELSFSSTWGSG